MANRPPPQFTEEELRRFGRLGGEKCWELYGPEHYKKLGAIGGVKSGVARLGKRRGPYNRKPKVPSIMAEIDAMIARTGGKRDAKPSANPRKKKTPRKRRAPKANQRGKVIGTERIRTHT